MSSLLLRSSTSITALLFPVSLPDGANVPFVPGHLWFLSFSGQRTYYYLVLVVLGAVLWLLSRFQSAVWDGSVKAVRDNENVATAYAIRPVWVKLKVFTLAGTLAGLGGALLSGAYANIPFAQSFYQTSDSLSLLTMVVIGGMGSISGAVLGAIVVIGIPAIDPNNAALGLLSSSLGLLIILLYFPRGLNQIAYSARDGLLAWADSRLGEHVEEPRRPLSARTRRPREVIGGR